MMVVVEVVRGRCGVWEVVRHALPAGLIWLGQYAWVCLIALHLSIILYSYSYQMCTTQFITACLFCVYIVFVHCEFVLLCVSV